MYSELKKIYDKTRFDVFSMATSYLMDIGYQTAKEITDEDIANAEGNGLMTAEFCGYLMKLAREIANAGDPCELIQLCQAEDVYDIVFFVKKVRRGRLEEIVKDFIDYGIWSYDELIENSYVEPEELVLLGYWTEDDLEKYYKEKRE